MIRLPALLVAALATSLVLAACAAPGDPDEVVTVRLWDERVAAASEESFALFAETHPGVRIETELVPWGEYWTRLRTDLAAGTLSDVFWTNTSTIDGLIAAEAIRDVRGVFVDDEIAGWTPAVVEQYSRGDGVWGVPQLTDLGIGLFVNTDALAEAGLDPADLDDLAWDPDAASDSLRRTATALTIDVEGRHPDQAGFDPGRVERYGYSASNDLNATLLSFLGSNGAAWQDADGRFVFASDEGIAALGYVVGLSADARVAPPAADTNPPAGSDTNLALFLRGDLALLQTGPYHLATIAERATFDWGIAPLPTGPEGRVTPTNGIVAAALADSAHPEAQEAVLRWLGSVEHQRIVGASGAALPAVTAAQSAYYEHWLAEGVDISPMVEALDRTIPAPGGADYARAEEAYRPLLNAVFLRDVPLGEGVRRAQDAANAATG